MLILFIRIDDEVIGNLGHEGRTVLTNAVKADFDAAELKMTHRRNPFDALDHAGGNCREKKLRRIENIGTTIHVRVKPDLGVLAVFRHGVPTPIGVVTP